MTNIYGHNYEYAIRPKPRPNPINNTHLWNKLIKLFSCDENYIMLQLT